MKLNTIQTMKIVFTEEELKAFETMFKMEESFCRVLTCEQCPFSAGTCPFYVLRDRLENLQDNDYQIEF